MDPGIVVHVTQDRFGAITAEDLEAALRAVALRRVDAAVQLYVDLQRAALLRERDQLRKMLEE
ncbi:MAG: hypothetical protein ACE147_00705 [Candidatus Methylomirabilales bacterium]